MPTPTPVGVDMASVGTPLGASHPCGVRLPLQPHLSTNAGISKNVILDEKEAA